MNEKEIQLLKYRRQYFLAPREIDCPFNHSIIRINETYILYSHTDLLVTEYRKGNKKLVLLGDIFDHQNTEHRNIDILMNLSEGSFETFLEKFSNYMGRYVLIYLYQNKLKLLHDATATRKIYYCNIKGNLWMASHTQLLAKLLGLKRTKNVSKLDFYYSHDFKRLNNSNLGNTTPYDNILQVLPNHYLDVDTFKVVRYWPDKKIERLPVSEVANKCAAMIKGYMKSIANRYQVMLPVTAGKDTRTLLAATRDFRNDVYYYINKERRLNDNSPDIRVPRELMKKLNLPFHIVDPYLPVDKNFEEIYFENHAFASRYFLPHIYNYYKNFRDKVNLPGNNAMAEFPLFKLNSKNISADFLADLFNVKKYEYARKYYADWLNESRDYCLVNNMNILILFYWEDRLTNWGTQIQIEKDISQEDFNPFNSRLLIKYYLSTDLENNAPPNFNLSRQIIRNLWPETLSEPFNPSFRHNTARFLKTLGILEATNKLKSRVLH